MSGQIEEKPRLLGVRGSALSDDLAKAYAHRFGLDVTVVRGRHHISLKVIRPMAAPEEYDRLASMAKPLSASVTNETR
jgi:hypothetical protein